jgi:hypothetical protein
VRPKTQNLNYAKIVENLIDQSMLDVDTARVRARQVANQFLEWGRGLIRIRCQDSQKLLSFVLESCGGQFLRILLGLPSVEKSARGSQR